MNNREHIRALIALDYELTMARLILSLIEGRQTEVYDRICGYYRPISKWNSGMTQNQKERVRFEVTS
jgi:ribonucleoside-triphosphate reductase